MGPSGSICLLTRQCVSRSPYSRNFGHESREQSGPAMSARDLQDVLEAVLDGVVVVDGEGRIELVNGEACRMLETSAEFAAGLPLARVADAAFDALVRSVRELGRPAIQDDRVLARRFSPDLILDVAAAPLWGRRARAARSHDPSLARRARGRARAPVRLRHDRLGHRTRGEEPARRDPRRGRDPRLAHERREVARRRGADPARGRPDPLAGR
ncbi:MAG: PAS domain-containing protein [Deltaproteobacteria bacterium]|nr:MAG: PAS domain-containing protein [Deltaproteobacteria bacterium]